MRYICILALLILFATMQGYSKSTFFDDNNEKIVSLHNDALVAYDQSNFDLAYKYIRESLCLFEKNGCNNDAFYAELLHDTGVISLSVDRFDLFDIYMTKAIAIKESLYGKTYDYFWSLETFANGLVDYSQKHDSHVALVYLQKAKDIWDQIPYKSQNENYAHFLNIYCVNISSTNIKKAIVLAKEELEVSRNIEQNDTIVIYSNLANLYSHFDNSECLDTALYYNSIVMAERERKEVSYNLAITYRNAARIYVRQKKYDLAIEYTKKAADLAKQTKGEDSEEYALSLEYLGIYQNINGNAEEAKSAYSKVYSTQQKNNDYQFLSNYAELFCEDTTSDSCFLLSEKASNAIKKVWIEGLCLLDSENKFYMNFEDRNRLILLNSIKNAAYYQNNNTKFQILAYENSVFLKNVSFRTSNQLKNKILESQDSTLINHYYSAQEDATTFQLSAYLIDKFPINFFAPTYNDIYSNLDSTDIAIEITYDYKFGIYYSSIIRNKWESPKTIVLDLSPIEQQTAGETRDSLWLPLYDCIWQPLISIGEIKNNENVYISLDGGLQLFPIEAIKNYDLNYVCDIYNIYRLSNTANISQVKKQKKYSTACLYGGLIYDLSAYSSNINNNTTIKEDLKIEIGDSTKSELRSKACYLPWTQVEIDSISATLKEVCMLNTKSGVEGIEESVKELSGGSPDILHFATHAFFTPSNTNYQSEYDVEKDYLRNSGLLFSGSTSFENSANNHNDGILRSEEIQNLDFSGTDLLVLSACDTGRGAIFSKDGVSGLQKAFKNAGVNTIVMSLEKIDDSATFLFMTSFYKKLVETNDKHSSFEYAKRVLRNTEEYKDYRYWTNYIMLD